jgi:RHS repeat-associated protein
LSQGTASSVSGWLIADLHGNIVAAVSPGSSPVYLDAYRYDPYGETVGSWAASSGSLTVPWRFQGRILESAAGGTDLYDFGARSYDPDLGDFTSFDSVAGSAQNPLTLNRYLYAEANPATLVDPDGHRACGYDSTTHTVIECPDVPATISCGYDSTTHTVIECTPEPPWESWRLPELESGGVRLF